MTHRDRSRLRAATFFVMRVPLLSFEELREWSEGTALSPGEGSGGDPALAQRSLEAERVRLQRGLISLLQRPEVRESLYLASPGFEGLVEKWAAAPSVDGHERIEQTLCKYFSRMASRPTPFGLFASISLGRTGEETELAVAPRSEMRRRSRLDLGYLDQLVESVARDPGTTRILPFQANPTLYRAGSAVRYVEAPMDQAGKRRHRLVGLRGSRALTVALERAGRGASVAEIEAALIDVGVKREAAGRFLSQLIECQALIPAVGAELTGSEPAEALIEVLSSSEATAPFARLLVETGDDLATTDEGGIGADLSVYRRVEGRIRLLPVRPVPQHLVQVDAARPAAEISLGRVVLDEIARGVEALDRMTPERGENAISVFRDKFENRYQGRQVPLMEALDSDAGIGFPAGLGVTGGRSPLIQGLELGLAGEQRVEWSARERLLLEKLEEAASGRSEEIVLADGDLAGSRKEGAFARRRGSFAAMVRLAARSEDELAKGRFRVYLSGIDGPGGARLLARFCGIDSELRREVEGLAEREAVLEPKGEIAEIVHVPEGRAGNVLHRPLLRRLEIPIMGRSGAPQESQLPLSDLLLSVELGELVLRSRRLGCRIVPRQTTAYDPMVDGVTANRFLSVMATEGQVDGSRWEWGPLSSVRFLPRVRYGRTILSLARWNIGKRSLEELRRQGADLMGAVREWRLAYPVPIPRWVALVEGDEHLAIDLENPLFVESFLQATAGLRDVALAELFPPPDELLARGEEGAFVSELVVPFELAPERETERVEVRVDACERQGAEPAFVRRFPPGSEWLFAKLYCGPVVADDLLRGTLGPFIRRVLDEGMARRWHFLRYGDPDWHLRLRFEGDADTLRGEVLAMLNDTLAQALADGTVWKLQVDTYDREVERYGGPQAVEIAEEIFQIDSELALWLVERLERGGKGEEERWKLALCGVDRLLADFGLALDERASVVGAWKESLAEEMGMGRQVRSELAVRYRRHFEDLLRLLSSGLDPEGLLRLGLDAIARRSLRLEQPIGRLRDLASAGELTLPLTEVASTFIHLQVNRILRSMPRATELVIYDFLDRLYRSRTALEREG